MTLAWSFRPMEVSDLTALVTVQERGAVEGLAHVFPQELHPFPRREIGDRWRREINDPDVAAYIATDQGGDIVGFAARRADEVLRWRATGRESLSTFSPFPTLVEYTLVRAERP